MNKLTVTFNNYKTYDFVTDDTNIQENDFVLVTSPVSDSGFGIARVKEVEENTKDINHKLIFSKINIFGDIALELLDRADYDHGEIFIQESEITFIYKKDREKALQKFFSELIDEQIKFIPIQKCDVGKEFYMLQLSDVKTDNYIEIDFRVYKKYINVNKYECAKAQTWGAVEFENYVFDDIPKEPIVTDIDDFEDTLSESIDIIKNTVSENVRYRITSSSGDYMLDDYVFEHKTFNGDGNYTYDEMCKEYDIFSSNTKEFIDNNVESIYDTAINAYTIDLILPLQVEVPDKYKDIDFALKTYVKIAESTITAIKSVEERVYVPDEDLLLSHEPQAIIEFNY